MWNAKALATASNPIIRVMRQLDDPNYYFLDDKGKLIPLGYEIIECL